LKEWLTFCFDEFDPNSFGKPLSIPKSAKKLDDSGKDTCLTKWALPLEFKSDDWSCSIYSNRDVEDDPESLLLFAAEVTTGAGSSGFCSYRDSHDCIS